jgi:putative glycosyltransferase (TIGR04372 family)
MFRGLQRSLSRLLPALPTWALALALWALAVVAAMVAWMPRRGRRRAMSVRRKDMEASAWTYRALRAISHAFDRGGNARKLAELCREFVYFVGSRLMSEGRLRGAERCLELAFYMSPADGWRRVRCARALGAVRFMLANIAGAHDAFRAAGGTRRRILARSVASRRVRNLGYGWFVAIGHVAMIDFYFKQRALGWTDPTSQPIVTFDLDSVPGGVIALQYIRHGLQIAGSEGIARAYDRLRNPDEPAWADLRADDQFGIIDDFWEYLFPDGSVLTYTHAAARIQQRWEAEGRKPLLYLQPEQVAAAGLLRREFGMPDDAWFACLHVREAGFHGRWNRLYPTARDADVNDYIEAIEAVTSRGGWIVRMGDPSMLPLPPMPRVVDYAHSRHKSEIADVLLSATCRFLIGTNSGFATVPGIYGVPNVLTNWVPIALPLWFGQDIMIPKLFRDRRSGHLIDFEQMLSTPLGATQNIVDFPEHIEICPNSPQEIREAVEEMIERLDGNARCDPDHEVLQQRYFALAERYGSYRGSRLGRAFLARYRDLLPPDESTTPSLPLASPAHVLATHHRAAVSASR